MKFFIDTANVEDIRKANDMGVICGVTTNPSLIAKEGRDFNEVIKEITSIVDGPISGEVKATTVDAEGMIKEGREIAAIHPNMVVKIPMTVEGLKAVKVLSAEGIKRNFYSWIYYSAKMFTELIYCAESSCGTHINDNYRLWILCNSCNSTNNSITAELCRIIKLYIKASFYSRTNN